METTAAILTFKGNYQPGSRIFHPGLNPSNPGIKSKLNPDYPVLSDRLLDRVDLQVEIGSVLYRPKSKFETQMHYKLR